MKKPIVKIGLGALFFIALLVYLLSATQCKQAVSGLPPENADIPTQATDSPLVRYRINNPEIPTYVLETLLYIRNNNKAPDKYVGGRKFYNREKLLPRVGINNKPIQYREWDVHPRVKGVNRGPERLVTSDNSAYYTKDHYKTFTLINK